MSNKSTINNFHARYAIGYLQMIFGRKRKEQKSKRKRERKNRKRGRK